MPSPICRGSPAGGDTTRNRASPCPATSIPFAAPKGGSSRTRPSCSSPRCAPRSSCSTPRESARCERRACGSRPTSSGSCAALPRCSLPGTLPGAGPVGSLLALFLARRGHHIQVFERRPDMRRVGIGAGRSINLAVSTRGLYALHQVGLDEEVLRQAIPMRGRIEFQQRLVGYEGGRARLRDEHSGEEREVAAPVVLGSDGSASALRAALGVAVEQSWLDFGYKELTIPPAPGGAFSLETNALHIWPRKNFMLIALPNLDGSFTCTLFLPFEGPASFAAIEA